MKKKKQTSELGLEGISVAALILKSYWVLPHFNCLKKCSFNCCFFRELKQHFQRMAELSTGNFPSQLSCYETSKHNQTACVMYLITYVTTFNNWVLSSVTSLWKLVLAINWNFLREQKILKIKFPQ